MAAQACHQDITDPRVMVNRHVGGLSFHYLIHPIPLCPEEFLTMSGSKSSSLPHHLSKLATSFITRIPPLPPHFFHYWLFCFLSFLPLHPYLSPYIPISISYAPLPISSFSILLFSSLSAPLKPITT